MPEKNQVDVLEDYILDSYDISKEQLYGTSRVANVVEARQVFCYCLRQNFKLSYPVIGEILKRDHTTVMHACEKIKNEIVFNKKMFLLVSKYIENQQTLFGDTLEGVYSIEESYVRNEKLLEYIEEKNKAEEKEFNEYIEKIKNEKENAINRANDEFEGKINNIKEKRIIQKTEYKAALKDFKKGKYFEEISYLSPKVEIVEKYDLTNKIHIFIPKFNSGAKELETPITFDEKYVADVLTKVDSRSSAIILSRYGFFGRDFKTLEKISEQEKVTRERIRQLITAAINKIYYNNIGGVRQFLEHVSKVLLRKNFVSIDMAIKDFYNFSIENKNDLIKFILVICSNVKWIKKFEFNNKIYLINYQNEDLVLAKIDKVKKSIKGLYENMPDMIENKWDYIYNNLKMFEYLQNDPELFHEDFLRDCYDNFLFESEVIVFKNDNIKKYNITNDKKEKTLGVPNEYEVFFK